MAHPYKKPLYCLSLVQETPLSLFQPTLYGVSCVPLSHTVDYSGLATSSTLETLSPETFFTVKMLKYKYRTSIARVTIGGCNTLPYP